MTRDRSILSLDEWRLREGHSYRALGELIGCQVNMAFAYCQPPGTKVFRCPGADRMARIWLVTNGEVPPTAFYDLPKLTRPFSKDAPELPLETAA